MDVLLTFSAQTEDCLMQQMSDICQSIAETGAEAGSSAYTLQLGRRELAHRSYLVWPAGSDIRRLPESSPPIQASGAFSWTLELATTWADQPQPTPEFLAGTSPLSKRFREALRDAVACFPAKERGEIMRLIESGEAESPYQAKALFACHYALCRLISAFVTPDACLAHVAGLAAYHCAWQGRDLSSAISSLGESAVTGETRGEVVRFCLTPAQEATALSIRDISQRSILTLLGELWSRGALVHWSELYPAIPGRISLPGYPFAKVVLPHQVQLHTEKNEVKTMTEARNISQELKQLWQSILGVAEVSETDEFFQLGGDSLHVVHMASLLASQFQVSVSVDEIMRDPVFKNFEQLVRQRMNQGTTGDKSMIKRAEDKPYYPASFAQQRMYTAQALEPESTAYNLAAGYVIEGELDIARLEQSIATILATHEALRTSFHLRDGHIMQRIESNPAPAFDVAWLEKDATPDFSKLREPFDLSRAPLMRVKLLRQSSETAYLFIDMHHIAGDQSSIAIFMSDLSRLYQGQTITSPKLRYVDYSEWQSEQLAGERYQTSLDFWHEELTDRADSPPQWGDLSPAASSLVKGRSASLRLSSDLSRRIRQLAAEQSLTPYALMVAAYSLLLRRYSGEEDLVLGTAVAGRDHEGLQDVFGMFVNTLPLRIQVADHQPVKAYLHQVKETVLQALRHQAVPLEMIMERLELKPADSLFEHCINYVTMGTDELRLGDLKLTPLSPQEIDVKYDLMVTVIDDSDSFLIELEYRSDHYSEATIDRFLNRFKQIVESFSDQPDQLVRDVEMRSADEIAAMHEWNDTKTAAPIERSVNQLFEEVVASQGEATALSWQSQELSYLELNRLANWLARDMHQAGVTKGDRIGLVLHQGIEQVVAILACLKLGAIYLPIGPDYPEDRIKYMLQDADCYAALISPGIPSVSVPTIEIRLDDMPEDFGWQIASPHTPADISGEDDIYIIYTSGSSGRPKGVVVQHQGVIRTVRDTNYYHITPQDKITQMINYTFDPAAMEIFGGLLNGAHLYMVPKALLLDFPEFERFIKAVGITQTIFVTPIFHLLMDFDPKAISQLKKVFIGGEALSPKHVRQALEVVGPGNVINLYGPTEGTIVASAYPIERVDPSWSSVPIGRPISGAQLYVVDAYLQPQPTGIAGELVITGPGVAREYLGREELTRERFTELPGLPGVPAYRTGDWVVLDEDRELRFKGRIDSQVKIGGYRIELDEIKHRILAIPGIAECFVRLNHDSQGGEYLEAYYVLGADEQALSESEITRHLLQRLPEYMVPSRLASIAKLPLTSNGKIDGSALAPIKPKEWLDTTPIHEQLVIESAAEDPLGQIRSQMARILDQPTIPPEADFFELGGQSLKAIALSQALRELGFNISVNDIFSQRSAKAIATNLKQVATELKRPIGQRPITPAEAKLLVTSFTRQAADFSAMVGLGQPQECFPFSPVQRFQLRIGRLGTGFGAQVQADDDATIKQRIIRLITQQELLHCVRRSDNTWQRLDASNLEDVLMHSLNVTDLSNYEATSCDQLIETLFKELKQTRYSIGEIPWRIFLAKLAPGHYQVVWCFDHLVFDGMSAQILTQGLQGQHQPHGQYQNYVKRLAKGPSLIDGATIRQKYQMETWFEKNQQLMAQLKGNDAKEPMVLLIQLPLRQGLDQAWQQGYEVFRNVLNRGRETALPMLLIDYGRKYQSDTYYDVVGEFLDFIPFYYEGADVEDFLMQRITQVHQDSLNFMWLLEEGQQVEAYQSLANQLGTIKTSEALEAAVYNFQGYVDAAQQELFEAARNHEVVLSASVFTNVYYDDDTMTVVIFSEYGFQEDQIKMYPNTQVNRLVIVNDQTDPVMPDLGIQQ